MWGRRKTGGRGSAEGDNVRANFTCLTETPGDTLHSFVRSFFGRGIGLEVELDGLDDNFVMGLDSTGVLGGLERLVTALSGVAGRRPGKIELFFSI